MSIDIQQPQPFDLVNSTILIAGNATAFEGQLSVKVTDGSNEVTGPAMTGGLAMQQFQASIDIPDGTFGEDKVLVTVSDEGGADPGEAPIPMVTVPVLFGPQILPGYSGYFEYTVVAGDTLTKIAQQFYDGSSDWAPIQAANQPHLTNPNLIFQGQVLRIPLA